MWEPEFDLSFVFYVDGKFAGRGGLQEEDSVSPKTSEIYFAVHPEFQNRGVASTAAFFLKDLFQKIAPSGTPLRGLHLEHNSPSRKILQTIGMKYRLDQKGSPLTVAVPEWENSVYQVMELTA